MNHISHRSRHKRTTGLLAALALALCFAISGVSPAFAADQAPASVAVAVKVCFEGLGMPIETFTVEMSGDGLDQPLKEEVTLSVQKKTGETSFDLGDMTVGIYEYTIRQIPGKTRDVTYDTREYTCYVMVNADGSVEQKVINKEDPSDKPDPLAFVNSYKDTYGVKGDPPVKIKKVITGKEPETDEDFVFIMEPISNTAGLENNPMPEGYGDGPVEVTVTGEGEVEIGAILFTEEGVYEYQVREEKGRVPGYSYDDAVYQVTYTVTRNGASEKLECTRQILKNGREPIAGEYCVFDNMYKAGPGERFRRAVETGDPLVMVPVTVLMILCIGVGTVIITRRRKEE